MRTFQGTNEYGDSIIESMVLSCEEVTCKGKSSIDIAIEGFRNPYFKPTTIDKVYPPKLTFAELKQYPNVILN